MQAHRNGLMFALESKLGKTADRPWLGVMHRGKARGPKVNRALQYVGLLTSEAMDIVGTKKPAKRGFGAIKQGSGTNLQSGGIKK